MIIERLRDKFPRVEQTTKIEEEKVEDEIHPLLKKISQQSWFPRGDVGLTVDEIIEAMLKKLPNASKSLFKTLTSNLVQMKKFVSFDAEISNFISKRHEALCLSSD